MATKKPPYKGDGAWSKTRDFSDNLKQKLKEFYPLNDGQDLIFGAPTHSDDDNSTKSDEFVEAILSEASFALEELHWIKFDIIKEEIRKEREDLLKHLKRTHQRLVSLSPAFERLLGIDADPPGCAGEIQQLINHVEQTEQQINKLPRAKKPAEKEYDIELEMAIRVLRKANDYGIEISGSDHYETGQVTTAVRILKLIGDDIVLRRHERVWSKIVAEAVKLAPDLIKDFP